MKFRIVIEIEQGSPNNRVLLEKQDGKSWKKAKFQGKEVTDVKVHEALRIAELMKREIFEREVIDNNKKRKRTKK